MANLNSFFSAIKSIQQGAITLAGVASNTATITSVDTSKTVLIPLGAHHAGNTISLPTDRLVKLALTSATVVTAARQGTTGTITVNFVVVEFN